MSFDKRVKAKGESWVWLSSMGVGIGLLMVVSVIGLIVYEGTAVFWPRNVVEITLSPEQAKHLKVSKVVGEITQSRIKKQVDKSVIGEEETQLYVANKDLLGKSFQWLDTKQTKQQTFPENVMMLERETASRALVFPEYIEWTKEGKKIRFKSTEATFDKEFDRLLHEADVVREQVYDIETGPINDITKDIKKLEIEIFEVEEHKRKELFSAFVQKQKTMTPEQIKVEKLKLDAEITKSSTDLRKQITALEIKMSDLSKVTSAKRETLKAAVFHYSISTGQTKTVDFGNVVHHYYPNRLGLGGRISLFCGNIYRFLTTNPREANTEGGVFPAIIGTLIMTLLMCIFVTPFGVMAAIYLREYAKQGMVVRMVRIAINNLAGVPSIVFGAFGLGFFVYTVGGSIDSLFFSSHVESGKGAFFGTGGILWASLTLALMTLPVVIVAAEEALASVPRGIREAAYGCGSSKWQMIKTVVLPASAPGIITGMILAMARGAGEVAPLMLVGVVKMAPELPIDYAFPFGLDLKFMHLGFHIYDLGFQSPDSEAAQPMVFATTLLLILLVGLLNLIGIVIRQRLRKRYATSAF